MAETHEFKSWMKLKIECALGHVEVEEASEAGNKIVRKMGMDEV